MRTNKVKCLPEVDQLVSVEPQAGYRCASGGCQADNPLVAIIPSKMIWPTLPARMEEGNKLLSDGIYAGRSAVLVVVASLTGKGQVFQRGLTTGTSGLDVLQRKRLRGKSRLTLAVFASIVGTLSDLFA